MTHVPTSSLAFQRTTTRAFTVHRLAPAGLLVTHDRDGAWTVHGHHALIAVAVIDLTRPGAVRQGQARLTQLGVDDELALAGAGAGELVRIGRLEFRLEDRTRPHMASPAA